jgi:hypothetical protein
MVSRRFRLGVYYEARPLSPVASSKLLITIAPVLGDGDRIAQVVAVPVAQQDEIVSTFWQNACCRIIVKEWIDQDSAAPSQVCP